MQCAAAVGQLTCDGNTAVGPVSVLCCSTCAAQAGSAADDATGDDDAGTDSADSTATGCQGDTNDMCPTLIQNQGCTTTTIPVCCATCQALAAAAANADSTTSDSSSAEDTATDDADGCADSVAALSNGA